MIKKGLNAGQLKMLAIIAMLMDHCLFLVIPHSLNLGVVMNMFGRITMPIMCYLVAEGFYHTKDIKKYLMRMVIFAIISQIPYYLNHMPLPNSLFEFIKGNILCMNVMCTLFMGLLSLIIAKSKINIILKIILVAMCVMLTRFCDWQYFGVLWVLGFGLLRGSFWKQAVAFVLIAGARILRYDNWVTIVIQSAGILALLPLCLYNGEKGKQNKYGFYIFYPAHLLVLGIVKIMMM